MSNPAKTFNQYLDSFTRGDVDGAMALIADNFKFRGPMLQSDDKAAFVEGAAPLGPIVRGYKMLRQFAEGDEVCSIYDFEVETPKARGTVTMTEWTKVRGGKLVESRLIFNSPEFAALMPQQ